MTISGNHNRTGSLARPDCSLHSSARLNARDALFPRATTATPGSPARAFWVGDSLRRASHRPRRLPRAMAARVGDVEAPVDGDVTEPFTAIDTRCQPLRAETPPLPAGGRPRVAVRRDARGVPRVRVAAKHAGVARVRREIRSRHTVLCRLRRARGARRARPQLRPGRCASGLCLRRASPAVFARLASPHFPHFPRLSLSLAHELTHALTHALTPFPRSRSPSAAAASRRLLVPALFPARGARAVPL